jgi:hypothetical protein
MDKPYGSTTMNISAPISIGELIDKITILEIKSERIQETEKLANIQKELDTLRTTWRDASLDEEKILEEVVGLKQVNETLWEIEDGIRRKESRKEFDEQFVELARSVYFTNDQRAALKKEINLKLGSELVEEKSYADYA